MKLGIIRHGICRGPRGRRQQQTGVPDTHANESAKEAWPGSTLAAAKHLKLLSLEPGIIWPGCSAHLSLGNWLEFIRLFFISRWAGIHQPMFHFARAWNSSAHDSFRNGLEFIRPCFISQWAGFIRPCFISQLAGIHPPMFHFAMDHHAIIADMDCPFIAASDFIAASRASLKCRSLLITLNPVGMLCFNEPIAPNLPPLLPSHLRYPFHWQSYIGRRSPDADAAAAGRRCTGRRGGSRGPAESHC
jgi:hypothetical protein